MPKTFDRNSERYYLKINEDPFSENVALDLVDGAGKIIQNFIKVTSLGISLTSCPIDVAHKAGMFGSQKVTLNGKPMMIVPEGSASGVITPIAEAA